MADFFGQCGNMMAISAIVMASAASNVNSNWLGPFQFQRCAPACPSLARHGVACPERLNPHRIASRSGTDSPGAARVTGARPGIVVSGWFKAASTTSNTRNSTSSPNNASCFRSRSCAQAFCSTPRDEMANGFPSVEYKLVRSNAECGDHGKIRNVCGSGAIKMSPTPCKGESDPGDQTENSFLRYVFQQQRRRRMHTTRERIR